MATSTWRLCSCSPRLVRSLGPAARPHCPLGKLYLGTPGTKGTEPGGQACLTPGAHTPARSGEGVHGGKLASPAPWTGRKLLHTQRVLAPHISSPSCEDPNPAAMPGREDVGQTHSSLSRNTEASGARKPQEHGGLRNTETPGTWKPQEHRGLRSTEAPGTRSRWQSQSPTAPVQ